MQHLQPILSECGLHINRVESVSGGDINQCYCLYGSDATYFLKVNEGERYPGMLAREADGLKLLRDNTPLIVPQVIRVGEVQQRQYLLMEWLDKGKTCKDSWQKFGTGLALLHQTTQEKFGYPFNNFIGNLVQENQPNGHWHSFYREQRIMPLVKRLLKTHQFNEQDLFNAENCCNRLEQIFPPEPPSLLHGDLWGGNFMITTTGNVAIFDPAVYFGHREMDIGMTRLFGGFDVLFYYHYNEAYPLQKGWEQRLPLTQLYPLLVHAVLFGAHYIDQSRRILQQFGN